MTLRQFVASVVGRLRANSLKAVGDPGTIVQTVALCGGSGAGLLFQAKQAGADVYLTGDVKYHEAQQASALGLALVDAGHFATEFPVVDCLTNYLSSCSREQKWDIPLYSAPGKDIFW
jgi:putative NIF3 family GTP cyclohydrolase 1 type 2